MKAASRLFGAVEYKESQVITFSTGLLGFQSRDKGPVPKRFVLRKKAETEPIVWLISVDGGNLELPLIDPSVIEPEYTLETIKVSVEARYALRGNKKEIDTASLMLFSVVTAPENIRQMSVDLRAPIVIDRRTRRGAQYNLSSRTGPRWPVRKNLYQELVSGRHEDRDGMMVISRRVNETIDIGDGTVEVLSIDGNTVRLGVVAPQHVKVTRGDFPATPAGENRRANAYVNLKDLEAVIHMSRIIGEPEKIPAAHEQQQEEAQSAG